MICENCKKAEAEIFGNGMHLCHNCNESIDKEMDKLKELYRNNTQPQRPRDLSDRELKIAKDFPESNVHVKLRMLIGAINVVRVTSKDSEIADLMTQILVAGGVLVDDD